MLEYDKIDVSQGIDVNETNASKECNIYHYWYFLNKGFKFEPYLCNGSHDLMKKLWTLMILLFFFFKSKWLQNSFLVYEERWGHKYNEKFWFKWRKWFFLLYKYKKKSLHINPKKPIRTS